jgi:hypothetical protein
MNRIFEKRAWRILRVLFFYGEVLFHAAELFRHFSRELKKRKALKN